MQNKEKKPVILAVDDHPHNVKLLASILEPNGYEVLRAYNGPDALKMAQESSPDVIILDVVMPGMDGFEVTEELRARAETEAIPVLILTALRDMESKVMGLESGADDFLSKPFNSIELLVRVRSLLRIKELHDELEVKNALLESVLHHYVSKDIASEILSNPDQKLRLGGESCVVSVLFADIRGFTHFSELYPASHVTKVLNHIFNALVPVIFEYEGTLDKYLGDAIMSFYGAPIPNEKNAELALRTACAMQLRFPEVLQSMDGMADLGLGIGICTGEAVVGNIGSVDIMDYTVIGNIPNTAKRLQESAKPGQILVDKPTYLATQDVVEARPIEPLMLKGRSEPIEIYEIFPVKGCQ